MKEIFESFKVGKYKSYIKLFEYFYKTLHDIIDTIFEGYIITLVLINNFDRYIIHTGAIHTYNLEKWFTTTLGYQEYFKAKQISDQVVDMNGLVFL